MIMQIFPSILFNSTESDDISYVEASEVTSAVIPDSTGETCSAALSSPPDKPAGENYPQSPSSCASLESLLPQVEDYELSKTSPFNTCFILIILIILFYFTVLIFFSLY